MPTFQFTVSYDGSRYAGWQVQSGQPTIQGKLEQALQRITGESLRVIGSGRTDAGVHARRQVASCRMETRLQTDELVRAINANLPDDIRVLTVKQAADNFHAIRSATGKRYRYTILDRPIHDVFQRNYVWHIPQRLDDAAMVESAAPLLGTHDFSSFEAAGAPRANSVRTVHQLDIVRAGDELWIEIGADGFLYNMVRNIVGTLVQVGRGGESVKWPAEVLAAKNRQVAGPTAPACGLCLMEVSYPE